VGYRHLFEPIPGTKAADAWRYWLRPVKTRPMRWNTRPTAASSTVPV